MSSVLIVSPCYVFPPHRANQQDIVSKLKTFKNKFSSVFLLCLVPLEELGNYQKKILEDSDRFGIKIFVGTSNTLSNTFVLIKRTLPKNEKILLWFEYSKTLPLLLRSKKEFSSAKVIYRSHNFEILHSFEKVFLDLKLGKRVHLFKTIVHLVKVVFHEISFIFLCDHVASISPADVRLYKLMGLKKVFLCSFQFLDTSKALTRIHSDCKEVRAFYMGSDLSNNINKAGALEIINKIIPELEKVNADVKIYITGKNAPSEIVNFKHPMFELKGFVDDLDGFLQGMDIAILPLKYGYGIKIKSLEALLWNFPVLGYSRAFRGLSLGVFAKRFVKNNPREIARAVMGVKYEGVAGKEKISSVAEDYLNSCELDQVLNSLK